MLFRAEAERTAFCATGKEVEKFMITMKHAASLYMTCEYQENPLGIQNEAPRFGWQLPMECADQSACRIWVYEAGRDDCVWDSGFRRDPVCMAVEYEGKPLKSRTEYLWKLEVELADGSRYEGEARFETGILKQEEWEAEWIQQAEPKQSASPLLIRPFTLDRVPEKSRVYISGIGYYELYINGQKAGDRVLEPGWTDYDKRVLYGIYDVTRLLRAGENTLGIWLGDGWYSNRHKGFLNLVGKYPSWYGIPKVICELAMWQEGELSGRLTSRGGAEGGWLTCDSPIIRNSIYDGEEYDGRMEKPGWSDAGYKPDEQWKPAIRAAAPSGLLYAQVMPPIRRTKVYRPAYMAYAENCSVVADFGQNLAGWARITVKGQAGQRVCLRYGEMTDGNGNVMQENLRSARAEDVYILKGEGLETYEPRFTYHGFRYMQIVTDNGVLVMDTCAVAVHSDVAEHGSFCCGSELLNRIQKAMLMTELNNLHSVPTDCPQRDERLAWVNDMTVRFEEALFNFDMMLFYDKWLWDLSDSQDEEKGCIPDTAPYFFGGREASHISSVYVLLPWYIYLFYGDRQPLKEHYEGMARYVAYKLDRRNEAGLMPEEFFGEWAPPMTESMLGWGQNALPSRIPAALVTTGYLYYDCRIMEKAAGLLGREEDRAMYAGYAEEAAGAINRAFFDEEKGCYKPDIQGCNLFPLFLGIVPQGRSREVLSHLLANLEERDYHVTTGNQLTKYLFEVLRRENCHEEAYRIASAETYPSIGFMLSNGATTIWERWENMAGSTMNSHDHPMLGAFTVWFYKALAGIRDEEGLCGTIHLAPAVVSELDFVTASVKTPCGELKSSWKQDGERVIFDIQVPWNTKVQLELPAGLQAEEGCGGMLSAGEHRIICRKSA